MCFRSKFDKLKREDVVDAICKLEREEQALEDSFFAIDEEIAELMKKGKSECVPERKVFLAKKINQLKEKRKADIDRAMFLMYNIRLLEKLKQAIDDKRFMGNVASMQLNKLLGNQKQLAIFLNKALRTKMATEDIMTSADETFREVETAYEPSEAIYSSSEADRDLLAVFEEEEALDMEDDIVSIERTASTSETDSI